MIARAPSEVPAYLRVVESRAYCTRRARKLGIPAVESGLRPAIENITVRSFQLVDHMDPRRRGWGLMSEVVEATVSDNPHFASLADGAPASSGALASTRGLMARVADAFERSTSQFASLRVIGDRTLTK